MQPDEKEVQTIEVPSMTESLKTCSCRSDYNLKIEQELDLLKGEFRQKEQKLIMPLLNKFERLEQLFTVLDQKVV